MNGRLDHDVRKSQDALPVRPRLPPAWRDGPETYLGMLVHGFRYSIRVLSLAYEHADVHVAGVYEVLLPRVFHDTALGDAPNCCRNSRLKWYCEAKPQRSATRLTRPRSGAPVERSRNARSSRQRVTKRATPPSSAKSR